MKRKLVSLLCAISMLAVMLGGCGGNSDKGSSQESSTGQEESQESKEESQTEESQSEESSETAGGGETSAQDLEYVELKWDVLTFQPDYMKDLDLVQAALDEYFKEKLNCRVILNPMDWGTFSENVPTKLMSGEELDLVTISNIISYNTYANMGAFYPIDTLWDEHGTNLKDLFSDGVWDSLKVNDHIYGVPVLKDNCYIIGYIYNQDLADALELDMEQGWANIGEMEDFLVEAVKIRNEKFPEYADMPLIAEVPAAFPYWVGMERFLGNEFAVCNIPGREVAPEMGTDTVFNYMETDSFRELCLMKQRLVQAGVLAYDYGAYETNVMYEPSTLLNGAWGYTWIDEHLYGDAFTTKLVVFDKIWTDGGNYTSAMTGIGANSKNPERAMMAMELLNTDPYVATMLRFGLEGEHWEKDGDGKMEMVNRNADAGNPGWLQWYGPFYGNLTIVETPESYGGPDGVMLKRMAEYNNGATLAAHMGFVPDTTPIENEISACNNAVNEYYDNLLSGKYESPEAVNQAIDEMIEKLKSNGSDRIVEEVQKQIDAWEASK